MERGLLVLSVLVRGASAACPDPSWTHENTAKNKCYKIAPGYVGHSSCAALCGTEASLACIEDSADDMFVQNWMATEGIPGTPRTNVWIGNYLQDDGNWSKCSNGVSVSYTNWSTTCQNPPCTVTSEAERHATSATHAQDRPCAMVSHIGWYARPCLYWIPCLCESGRSTSTTYTAWVDANIGSWMAPWMTKGLLTFAVALVLGIIPCIIGIICRLSSTKPPGSWAERVKGRVSFVMTYTGWLLLCVGFAPILAFFSGFHAVYAIGYPQIYAGFIPVGVCCWLLALAPDNPNKKALISAVIFFSAVAAVGVLAILFWGLWSFWISGLIMGIIFLLSGIGLITVSAHALCTLKEARARNMRLWASMRLFFLILVVVSVWLLLDYVLNLNSQFSENIGWVLLAISSLVCTTLTRPPWRNKFCVWLAGMGKKGTDFEDARNAALLVWVDFSAKSDPRTEA